MKDWQKDFDSAADRLQEIVDNTVGREVFWITNRLAMALKRLRHDVATQVAQQEENEADKNNRI